MSLPPRLAAQLCGLLALLSASFTARAADATASAAERKPPAITVSTLGSPLPSCGNVTDPEALTEFEIQTLDAYLRQSLDTQAQPEHRESIP